MLNSPAKIIRGAAWTIGAYAISTVFRFGSNVALSRLLAPEIFGMALIAITLKTGMDLLSDIGLGQNVVHSKEGDQPEFYNTVWVLQIIRGFLQVALLFVFAVPLAALYQLPVAVLLLSAVTLAITGFASTSIFLMQRRLKLAKLNMFDLAQDGVSAVIAVTAAYISPTIWSLLVAGILATIIRTISSFFLGEGTNRPTFVGKHAAEIVTFGRWIFLSSLLGFLCASFDRLYIGQAAPLAVLGVYGIARSIAELPSALAGRLSHSMIFPMIASEKAMLRSDLRALVAPMRFKMLVAAAVCVAFAIVVSDGFVKLIYDHRYVDAAWMLPLLLFGVWLTILCMMNEYTLLGVGRPLYGVAGNTLKLAYFFLVLPLSFQHFGILGAISAIAVSEVGRYLVIAVGQRWEGLSFLRQDVTATLVLIGLVALLSWCRFAAGFGTPFDHAPFEVVHAFLEGHR